MKKNRLKHILCMMVLVASCLVLGGCQKTVTINLNDYVEPKTSGYDSKGSVSLTYDEESLIRAINSTVEIKDEMKHFEILEYVSRILYEGEWDKHRELSNGDKVTYSWTFDSEEANSIYKGLKITCKDIELEVNGLQEVGNFDPMEDLTITYEGMAPNAIINVRSQNYPNLSFKVSQQDGLKMGDQVEVTLASSIDECINYYGMIPTNRTITVTVDAVDGYACHLSDITDELFQRMESEMMDAVKAMYAKKKYSEYVSSEILGYYLLSSKGSGGNYLYIIYKVDVHTEKDRWKGHVSETVSTYSYIRFNDIETRKDGTCYVDLLDYKMPGKGLSGPSFESSNSISYDGYEKLDILYNQEIESRIDEYTVDTNIME